SERQRPNPFAAQPPAEAAEKDGVKPAMGAQATGDGPGQFHLPNPLALPPDGRITMTAGVEEALMGLVRLDRGFTLSHFVSGAQDAFVMIVEAYAAGDRDLLKSLLSPDLYKAFDGAIAA